MTVFSDLELSVTKEKVIGRKTLQILQQVNAIINTLVLLTEASIPLYTGKRGLSDILRTVGFKDSVVLDIQGTC